MIPASGGSAGEGIGCPCPYSWASLVAQLALRCGRPRFDPLVGKICWRQERLLTPVFWPGELHTLYSPWGRKELDTTERFSLLQDDFREEKEELNEKYRSIHSRKRNVINSSGKFYRTYLFHLCISDSQYTSFIWVYLIVPFDAA